MFRLKLFDLTLFAHRVITPNAKFIGYSHLSVHYVLSVNADLFPTQSFRQHHVTLEIQQCANKSEPLPNVPIYNKTQLREPTESHCSASLFNLF